MIANYVIWSNEHVLWWAPRQIGYTPYFAAAGRYSEDEAKSIVHEANRYRPRDMQPNEVALKITETVDWPND